jgi:DNA-binding XRE family transcriptional regulator/predicted RNase H-like HicB family nuclease
VKTLVGINLSPHWGRIWRAVFVDAPGCATCAPSRAGVLAAAAEALDGWLEAHLVDGQAPPRPTASSRAEPIVVDPQLAVAVSLRWARQAAGLTQAKLARRVGVSQQQVAKLERPGANPSIATLHRVAGALGVRLELDLVA